MTDATVSACLSEQERPQTFIQAPVSTVTIYHRAAPGLVDASLPNLSATPRVTLPVLLARPNYSNIRYVRHQARERVREGNSGSIAYQGMRNCQAKDLETIVAQDGTLRNETTLVTCNTAYPLPTHLLAVRQGYTSSTGQDVNGPMIKFFPVNGLFFAIECATLPPLPHHVPMIATPGSNEFTVPVIPLSLPSPGLFNILLEFLYCKQKDILLQRFLLTSFIPDAPENYEQYATFLASKFSSSHLLNRIFVVHGFWNNVVVLGVFDDDLWDALGIVWKLLLMAISLSHGQPEIMEAVRTSATSLQDSTPTETKLIADGIMESMKDFFNLIREAEIHELKRQQNDICGRIARLEQEL